MVGFLLNIALAAAWCLLNSFDGWNFVAGLVVGSFVVDAYSRLVLDYSYYARGWSMLVFLLYFIKILNLSNLKVAMEVLTPKHHQTPRIIRYRVGDMSASRKTVLANAITLTPGTLVIDESPDGEFLYIHCMYAQDRAEAIDELDELNEAIEKGLYA